MCVDGGERVGLPGGDGGDRWQRPGDGALHGGGKRGRPPAGRANGGGPTSDGLPGVGDGVYGPSDRTRRDAGQGDPLSGAAGADRRPADGRGPDGFRVDRPGADAGGDADAARAPDGAAGGGGGAGVERPGWRRPPRNHCKALRIQSKAARYHAAPVTAGQPGLGEQEGRTRVLSTRVLSAAAAIAALVATLAPTVEAQSNDLLAPINQTAQPSEPLADQSVSETARPSSVGFDSVTLLPSASNLSATPCASTAAVNSGPAPLAPR